MKNILVSGTLAYDRIMNFPGYFKDHILPDKIHILNVSFAINKLKESFGGTGGNIAYNLSLLGEEPVLLGMAGNDFGKYEKWLRENKINITYVKKLADELTASAYIITDQSDNQITGFYQGPLDYKYCQVAKKIKNIKLAIVAPDVRERMLEYVKLYKKLNVPYVFDPGQQLTALSSKDLRFAVNGAKVLIGNDYEIELIKNRINTNLEKLCKFVNILVITKGNKGSEIYSNNKKIQIPPAKPKNTCDPTGAGDAYRAGLIKGLIEEWPLEKVGRLAGLVAVYTVEKYGTQTHRFTWKELERRYEENYKEKLEIRN
ncbi:MAG: carbohydrate kinase family protein [Patescibacteria group bacterium]|nr:carbohydrate kinase family protein [Patescibacteria group bacterium]